MRLDQLFGDLHRVQSGALAQVVGDDPQAEAILDRRVVADAADVNQVLARRLDRRDIAFVGALIDDGDACFRAGGTPTSLRQVSTVGEGSDLIWTHTTDRATEDNYAEWSLVFAEGGRYQLEVSTPAAYAQSTQARYQVELGGIAQEVVLDQTAVDGWQSLGAFDVTAGGEQRVHLGDNTGEPGAEMVKLVFDGLRITRLDGGSGSGSDAGSGSGAEPGAEPGEEGGCTAGGGGAGLVVALAALRRRRRRRRQR